MKKEKRTGRSPSKKSNSRHTPKARRTRLSEKDSGFCIVGIGASAGGLEALEKFFDRLQADNGLGFVIVQHLDPDHKSMLVDILKRHTPMKISEVKEGVQVKPNTIYIIPPNHSLSIFHGRLHLTQPERPHGVRLPIDSFFRSLAEDRGDKSICIVLSGTGSDGALGLKAIKEAGGMTMAQEESSAKYASMPRSAIATGCVDHILKAEMMPQELMNYTRHPYILNPVKAGKGEEPPEDHLDKIFMLLRSQTGHDFSLYKRNTISRRIERRMALHQINKINDYLRYLEKNKPETELLFREFLIGVTRFFRDPEVFEALNKKVIIPLFEGQDKEVPLRIWVAGCSSGEEAYSIAILLQEEVERSSKMLKAQIFATDIDSGALETGRLGLYPDSIAVDVSPERLRKFFTKEGNHYRIKKAIREMIIFAKQDLIKDPPFSRLDLIICRNLMIYFGSTLQRKILPLFHYVLNPGRFLLLGPSETIGEFSDLFSLVDKKWKIFQHKSASRLAVNFPTAPLAKTFSRSKKKAVPGAPAGNVVQLTESMLLEEYAPSYVIINEKYDILHFRGRTGRYLEPPTGEATLNILKLAKEGLRIELRTAIHKAFKSRATVVHADLKVKENGKRHGFNLIVKPLKRQGEKESIEGVLMVIFDDGKATLPFQEDQSAQVELPETDRRILDLEHELNTTKESLQTAIEELETSNEELKSTNEELQSTNEELQSANEELETSKEELQSINEELVTVNSELQSRVDELANASDDMLNLLGSTEIATLFLDTHLRIKRFTPTITDVINISSGDVGKSIGAIVTSFLDENLAQEAESVLKTLVFMEKEITTRQGRWYRMKITPYRTRENVIGGVVVVFINITELKRANQSLKAALQYAENVIATIREPFLVLDKKLRVVSANQAYLHTFDVRKEETLGQLVYSLGNGQWNIPALKKLLEETLNKGTTIENYEVSHHFEQIGFRKMSLNARKIKMDEEGVSGDSELILLAIWEYSEKE
jgi:two-component system CheB/CheR fusion protein